MKKLAIPFCLFAAATLAACGTPEVRSDSAESFVNPVANSTLRTGVGKVVVLTDPTGPVDAISWQRMTLRMLDGGMQTVDRRGHQVAMGENVRVR
jgi:hypothetical protein